MAIRYRDDDSASSGTVISVLVGALAGLAVGMLVAQRMGGLSGIRSRLARRTAGDVEETDENASWRRSQDAEVADYEDYEDDELVDDDEAGFLEERVLEAFTNDPILAERAVDIGAIGEGIIELAGWVNTESEAAHAVTLARGVPGVDTVVNRLMIGDRERQFEENARRVQGGDPSLTEARWEGTGTVGTGRRRQGTSQEIDRHADPRVNLLQRRWLSEEESMRNAADDTNAIAERRHRDKPEVQGDRTGGAPIAPTGVPKGDHVVNPIEADPVANRIESTRGKSFDGSELRDSGNNA
jgi:hypothetical protein